jgi:hypothetical protein
VIAQTRIEAILLLTLCISSCSDREFIAEFANSSKKNTFVREPENRHIAYRIDEKARTVCEKPAVPKCKAVYEDTMKGVD